MAAQQIVSVLFDAVERGDVDGMLHCMAEDCEWDNVPLGKCVGHDQIRSVLTTAISPETPGLFEVVRQASSDTIVMNERIDTLTIQGKRVTIAVAGVFEVRDGKIVLWRDYFDLGQWNAQLAG